MNSLNTAKRLAAIKKIRIWLLLSFVFALAGYLLGMRSIIPGPAATETLMANAGEKIAIAAGLAPNDSISIILRSSSFNSDSLQMRTAVKSLQDALLSASGLSFQRIVSAGETSILNDQLVSDDGKALLIIADTKHSIDTSAYLLRNFPIFLENWKKDFPWLEVNYLSQGTLNNEMFDLINQDLDASLFFSLPITLVILLWAFRSLVAASLPLLLAIVSLLSSLGVSAILSQILEPISATSAQLVVLLVLAIGVDYSLFIVSRVREELQKGKNFEEAVSIASKYTGSAVFWSGLTVALSLTGLLFMHDTVLTSMALVSIVSVLITVSGCLFVLPAILIIIGERRVAYEKFALTQKKGSSLQKWLIHKSIEKPIVSLISSLLLLGFFASFVLELKLGTTVEPSIFPASMQSRLAMDLLQNKFPNMAGVDISLILHSNNRQKLDQSDNVADLLDEILAFETVRGPVRVQYSDNYEVARYEFLAVGSANDLINQELVHHLNNKLIPNFKAQTSISAYSSGTLPYVVDALDRHASKTPQVFAAVLFLSFIFLLLAFRSVVVPIKAIALNLLSTAVAFGVLAIVFNLGAFGFWHYGIIEAFVPALLYSILFGLSMDYHVLLLSRIQEEVLLGHCTKTAVSLAVSSTARSITSAALIMVSVFSIIASLKLPLMKELGFGLAVAVIVDATIIRLVLLPASMVLLNRWNWYLPKCLEWLPRIRI